MENNKSNGIGFSGLLLVAFIVLKLCKVIDWDWWWVMSPLWIPLGLLAIIGIGYLIYYLLIRKKVKEHVDIGKAIKNESAFQRRLREAQEKQRAK